MFFLFSRLGVTVNLFAFVGEIFATLWLASKDVGAHSWNLGRIAWNLDRIAIPDQGVGKYL